MRRTWRLLLVGVFATGSLILLLKDPSSREPSDAVSAVRIESAVVDSGAVEPEAPAGQVGEGRHQVTPSSEEIAVAAGELTLPPGAGGEAVNSGEAEGPPPAVLYRLVDTEGRALPGVEVSVADLGPDEEPIKALTDNSGEFELRVASPSRASLEILDPDWTCFAKSPGKDGAGYDFLVVASRTRALVGEVLDESGAPIPGASVRLGVDSALFRHLGVTQGLARRGATERVRATTDQDGWFELSGVVGGSHAFLEVKAQGYLRSFVDLPVEDPDVRVVLERSADELLVHGRVLLPDGTPAQGATVSLGDAVAFTTEDGSFACVGQRSGPRVGDSGGTPATIVAVHKGHSPARQELLPGDEDHEVVLQLGSDLLATSGRVADPNGEPVPGAVVWVEELTPLGHQVLTRGTVDHEIPLFEEEVIRGGFNERGVRADSEGRFTLEGLVDRRYEFSVADPDTGERNRRCGTAWGGEQNVALTLAREPDVEQVAGRLVTSDGHPLGGIRIELVRFGGRNAIDRLPRAVTGIGARTSDEEGRFDLGEIATKETELMLNGRRVFQHRVPLSKLDDLGELRLVVPLLCEMQVDLGEASFADQVVVLDAGGAPLVLVQLLGKAIRHRREAPIADGLSDVIYVVEDGRTVVLFKQGDEVARVPLQLERDSRTTVRV